MGSEAKKEFLSLLSQIEGRNREVIRKQQQLLEAKLVMMKKLDAALQSFIMGTDITLSKQEPTEAELDSFSPADSILMLNDKSIKFMINDDRSDEITLIVDVIFGDRTEAHPRIGRLEMTMTKSFFYDRQDRSRDFNEANFYHYIAVYLLPKKL